jgi:23S rRNA (uracil1939-C5)-methyltransferase
VRVIIEGISHIGEGVARLNGKAVFVPYTIPGEEVKIDINREYRRYTRAVCKQVLVPSKDRVEPTCPHYTYCGGCGYQHVNYQRELELKRQVVENALQHIGRLHIPVYPVIGMEQASGYRNKVVWHCQPFRGQLRLGYYREKSNDLIPINCCQLLPEPIHELSKLLAERLDELEAGPNSQFTIRYCSKNRKLMLLVSGEINQHKLTKLVAAESQVSSLFLFRNGMLKHLLGDEYLTEQIEEFAFRVSPLAFLQINPVQTVKLYRLVDEYSQIKNTDMVLDAYCGIGTISLYLARKAYKVNGIELVPEAIADARYNADLNGITNAQFYCGPVEKLLPELHQKYDLVVLDPPRAGCHIETIQAVAKTNARRIIYVSCNPSTLARDLRQFQQLGYQSQFAQPVDMFPRTSHVECVVLITRGKE